MGFDQLWNTFVASLPTLKDAWPTVIGLMILAALAGFGFSSLLGSSAHHTKDERIKLAEERVGDYKEKLEGKSPDEAQAQIAALRDELAALASYGLSSEGQQRLKGALAGASGAINIYKTSDASDADRLYRQAVSAFRAAGWTVKSHSIMGLQDRPDSGVTLIYWDATDKSGVATVRHALDVAGLNARELTNPTGWGTETNLTIVFSSRDPDWVPPARFG